MKAGLFAEAVEILGLLLHEGDLEGETWYREGALAMKAFGLLELGRIEDAILDISQINDELEIFWIANVPVLIKSNLLRRAANFLEDRGDNLG